jgi:GGDEF domain-containing protein
MNSVAVGFWGAYFGTVGLLLGAALLAFRRSAQRLALTAFASAAMSGLFTLVYLDWLPLPTDATFRLKAHVAIGCAGLLGVLLLDMLGVRRDRRIPIGMAAIAVLMLAAGWALPPRGAFLLATAMAGGVALAAVIASVRSASRGARLAWLAVTGIGFMVTGVAGISWIAWQGTAAVPWPLHAFSAFSGMAYLLSMAAALWVRYSFLIELHQVMVHGPAYDPVTRMRTHAESSAMVVDAFNRRDGDSRPLGVLVVSIGNLYALEQLHGRAAVNHALFLCASRLRRCVPPEVEMGRLGQDGFLLVMRHHQRARALIELAQQVAQRLARPVEVGTTHEIRNLQANRTEWVADVGIGVLQAPPELRPSNAVAMGRAMSRTAWSYVSRIAWFDPETEQIAELPAAV